MANVSPSNIHLFQHFLCHLYIVAIFVENVNCSLVIYSMVESFIADISDPKCHICRGALRLSKYATEVRYRSYGPTYHTVYDISCGECTTDEPFCMRQLNIFETMSFFTRRLVCHLLNLVTIHKFLWLCNPYNIYT